MTQELQKLHSVWISTQKRANENTLLPQIKFDEIASSIISSGPFYYYIIDFYDMSLSNVSPAITDIHGFDPETVSFNDILGTIHPNDVDFIVKAEASILNFFYTNIGAEKLTNYKMNYSFRSRMKNGEYCMLNHQAIILTLDPKGGFGKSLNIHTRIDHLTKNNTYQYSMIGLKGEPSYMNIDVFEDTQCFSEFSKREIDIIKLIAEGFDNNEIAETLFISVNTVKQHRKNILKKSNSRNTAQLIRKSTLQGLL
ncbi:LuxR C-terminal-related transcriptional regulator [Flavobacterium yafengii]|uniref:LuxR C-terminal-related transcriptional regulator n=1 Tax=Flavobacterium yafengii TaxID=3041253 RepID=A0AAW6TKI4_9FLAO|nr:LuxR C-terminal-related transcriptional regulator [Flavobacterium yafengii]MDI5949461.1 LuxR C-terminal-related transcriptional regulator [Flavobacterium yafengii]